MAEFKDSVPKVAHSKDERPSLSEMLKGLTPDQFYSGQEVDDDSSFMESRRRVVPTCRHPQLALLLCEQQPTSEVISVLGGGEFIIARFFSRVTTKAANAVVRSYAKQSDGLPNWEFWVLLCRYYFLEARESLRRELGWVLHHERIAVRHTLEWHRAWAARPGVATRGALLATQAFSHRDGDHDSEVDGDDQHYSNSGSDGSDSDDASEASEDGVSEAGSDIPPSLASDTDSDDSDLDFSSVVDTGEEA
ncbi:hypothetical protein CYMTET_17646 [Cymbomonas tetramitiformis]|uniref:Uncharacterized protein n=1 Tax=Cymbomonas tetramitiformis TaxID=36881 RepID=A0AAE0GB16_9CHLO|nr:hypothetical protein CYMTET_17646 [Cymbomonas tetramitiformis]